jgi:fructokinase
LDKNRVDRHGEEYKGFEGVCPFHKSCLEGMVCNKSIAERLNVNFTQLHEVSDQEKIWKVLGNYLAQLCLNVTLTISPEVIVIGGGIMNRKILYKYIQEEFIKLLAKYVDHPLYTEGRIENYIKPPTLGSLVGVKGAMILK